jgi:uncharacterized membrane protein
MDWVPGGIGLPPVPELQAAYAASIQPTAESTAEATPENSDTDAAAAGEITTGTTPEIISPENRSLADKLAADPKGNALAIITLIGLIVSLGLVLWYGPQGLLSDQKATVGTAIVVIIAGSAVVGISLAAKSSGDSLATLASWGIVALLAISAFMLILSYPRDWVVPLIAAAGSVRDLSGAGQDFEAEATCGLIGDCNTVQQSKYASLFGTTEWYSGGVGYVAILAIWAERFIWGKDSIHSHHARAVLLGLTLFGVAFSTYLTFLEPFVIGATCAWCITSALTMLLLLWLVAPAGWDALRRFANPACCCAGRVFDRQGSRS